MTSDETNSGRPSVCFGNWQSDKGVKVGECVGCTLLQTLPLPPLSDKQLSQSSPGGPRRNLSVLLDLIAGALSIKSRRPPLNGALRLQRTWATRRLHPAERRETRRCSHTRGSGRRLQMKARREEGVEGFSTGWDDLTKEVDEQVHAGMRGGNQRFQPQPATYRQIVYAAKRDERAVEMIPSDCSVQPVGLTVCFHYSDKPLLFHFFIAQPFADWLPGQSQQPSSSERLSGTSAKNDWR